MIHKQYADEVEANVDEVQAAGKRAVCFDFHRMLIDENLRIQLGEAIDRQL
jgi:hypothetical protein